MSGGTGGPPGKAPKQLSSRLMTMKRAAASSPGASASSSGPTPKRLKNNSSQPSTPPSGPSSGTRTPAYPAAPPASDSYTSGGLEWRRAAQEAARAEAERRQAALERAGTQGEETRWALCAEEEEEDERIKRKRNRSENGLRIVRYDETDDEEEDTEEIPPWRADGVQLGRMRFGGFKRKGEAKRPAEDISDNDGSDAESDSDASRSSRDANDESPRRDGPQQRSTPDAAVRTPARGRGAGISSGGGSGGRPSDGDSRKCFRCGQPGHIKSQCPMNTGAMHGRSAAGRRLS